MVFFRKILSEIKSEIIWRRRGRHSLYCGLSIVSRRDTCVLCPKQKLLLLTNSTVIIIIIIVISFYQMCRELL